MTRLGAVPAWSGADLDLPFPFDELGYNRCALQLSAYTGLGEVHGLFSWMGAASMGGFLGADIGSFFSSVVSCAAGSFFVTLVTSRSNST